MADENTGTQPEQPVAEIDIEAVEDLSPEDSGKLLRGEVEPPRKGAKAAVDAPAGDEFDVDPSVGVVPHSKFHNVNERRKAAEAERQVERTRAEQAEARANTAMQRLAEIMEASKPAPVQQEQTPEPEHPGEEPDAVDDPYGYNIWRQKADRYIRHRQSVEQSEQSAAEQFAEAVRENARQFKVQTPDYGDAYQFYRAHRGAELTALGYNPQQVKQIVDQDEEQIARIGAQRRQSPAAMLYNIAKARGYQPGNGEAADPATVNGAADRQRDANGKFVAEAAKMDKREDTKLKAKSLGGSGGPTDAGALTPEMLVDMSDAEYDAWKKANGGEGALRKFFGARQ